MLIETEASCFPLMIHQRPPGAVECSTVHSPAPCKLQMFLFSILICCNRSFGSFEASLKSDGMKPFGTWEGTQWSTYLSHTVPFSLTPTTLHPWDSLPEFLHVWPLYLWCLPWLLEQYCSNCGGRYQTEVRADALGFFIGQRETSCYCKACCYEWS